MNLLVTGGTGFVGTAVVAALQAEGHAIRMLVRPGSSRPRPPDGATSCVERMEADPWAEGALERAMGGMDAVVHLVGIISEVGAQTFERVHTDLTRRVVEAAAAAGVRRYLHMSALGTRAGARAPYHQTKWAAEERVRAANLGWTIFRPSLIYGPGDGFTRLFARIAAWSPVVPVMGPGTSLVQPIAVAQVARAFAVCAGRPQSEVAGRTYDLCGPERLTFEEVIRAVLDAAGRRRPVVHIPWPVARIQARVLEGVFPAVLGQAPPLNRSQLLMLAEDNIGDGGPADRAFGLVHETFRAGIGRYLGPGRGV